LPARRYDTGFTRPFQSNFRTLSSHPAAET
jgi:hypothetical protein